MYDVSIVIVSYNTKNLTRKCLLSVQKFAGNVSHEVIVVDNASSDGSAEMIESEFNWVKLIRLSNNLGFAAGNNRAIEVAKGRYILLLNSDAFLDKGILENTIAYMDKNPRIGVLGCKLINPDGTLQPSARSLPSPLNKILHISGLSSRFPKSRFFGRVDYSWWDHSAPKIVGWVVGAYFLIREETISQIGCLDERYFLYFEEIDFCLSAKRAGWDVVFYPLAEVVHIGGQSSLLTNQIISEKGRQRVSIRLKSEFRYYRKMYGVLSVIISAFIESAWNITVMIKNLISKNKESQNKITQSRIHLRLIFKTLINDKFGKGQN
ncbi:MAG: glycosyltransferase family 2 protein [Desulfobacterales bacterium]|nr:glycosyltransferase family 2 protein [Desulfobacterales bacterium]MBF0397819.1 glycosyltransferase family 2 protein [Desulfobacterales bacterium]